MKDYEAAIKLGSQICDNFHYNFDELVKRLLDPENPDNLGSVKDYMKKTKDCLTKVYYAWLKFYNISPARANFTFHLDSNNNFILMFKLPGTVFDRCDVHIKKVRMILDALFDYNEYYDWSMSWLPISKDSVNYQVIIKPSLPEDN